MRQAAVALLAISLLLPACRKSGGDLGRDAAGIASDTAVIRDAQAAANEIVRNAQDCDAVRGALPEVNRKLEQAAARLQTAAGRSTLETLKTQVARITRNCS